MVKAGWVSISVKLEVERSLRVFARKHKLKSPAASISFLLEESK